MVGEECISSGFDGLEGGEVEFEKGDLRGGIDTLNVSDSLKRLGFGARGAD